MKVPLPQLLQAEQDLLYQRMRAAYYGDPRTWQAVNESLRDAMVDYALRRSPYYQRTIPPGANFADLPILTKSALRQHLSDLLAQGVPTEWRYLERTSGSTGEPVALYRGVAQQLINDTANERFCRWLHGVPFDATIVAVTAVGTPDHIGRWRHLAMRARAHLDPGRPQDPMFHPVVMAYLGPDELPLELKAWARYRRYFLLGNASGIEWIADQIEQRGLELRHKPVAAATNADMLTENARARIERVFGCPVHTRYGSCEFRRVAVSLPGTIDRYLFNPLLVHTELLDEQGKAVPAGETGRLILTDLNNYVTPMIRYEQGDLGVMSVEGHIGGFKLIDDILGRNDEVLRLPRGKILAAGTIGNHLFLSHDFGRWIRFFQCAQTDPNALELRIVWDGPSDEGVRGRLRETLREICEADTEIHVKDIRDLDRLPSGKVWIVRKEFKEALG